MGKEERPELPSAKREQILDGARALFREVGYERASVDAIAARAGVSKATIYNHFRSKEALFLSTLGAETAKVREKFLDLLEAPTGDIEKDLRLIADQFIRLAISPNNVRRHRMVVAEADRFPELGRALYECSDTVAKGRLARFFDRAAELGMLEITTPDDAATDFSSLCVSKITRMLHLGVIDEASEETIARHADRAVRTFLRAYLPLRTRLRMHWEPLYRATTYCATWGEHEIRLRIGEKHPELDERVRGEGRDAWAYLTAWNPGSIGLSEERNRSAQAELEAELERRGLVFFPGASEPDDGSPPEASVLVLLGREEALELARRFGQNAFVGGRVGGAAELVWS